MLKVSNLAPPGKNPSCDVSLVQDHGLVVTLLYRANIINIALWNKMILPTQSKLHRMGTIRAPVCKIQGCIEIGTLEHELMFCDKNDEVGTKLVHCLQQYIPSMQADHVLRLVHGKVEEDLSLPITLLTAIILSTLWKEREAGQPIRGYKIRAELEQSINLLRTTRYTNTLAVLSEMSQMMFH